MKRCAFFFVLCLLGCLGCRGQGTRWSMAFWNVENFFDTWHDTLKNDFEFTPDGKNHWTKNRYEDKRDKIFKMIAAMMWPDVIGLSEVENDHVLRDLCLGTPLRKFGYHFIHYESPDQRGSDCALLYRKDNFQVLESRPIYVSDTLAHFFTRDILLVGGILTGGDSCYILVNHWPSKLSGAIAERHRYEIAQKLLSLMDSLDKAHPAALVLAMGDFNSDPYEPPMTNGMDFDRDGRNAAGLYNLMYQIPKGTGSYKYHGHWSCIDQMIANRELEVEVFAPPFVLQKDRKYMGYKVSRTYLGMRYLGGFSDHLPIIVRIP